MNKLYDIWFHKLKLSIYDKKYLMTKVKSTKALYEADTISYAQWGLNRKGIERIEESKSRLSSYEDIILNCQKEAVDIISYCDTDYPKLLKEIPDPPMLLYSKGKKALLNEPSIAIVGTRKCTEYGDYMAKKLALELTEQGFIVTSGMANGIDAIAHKSALKKGNSIAVLGTGVNVCYPMSNIRLYHELLEKGCIVSEYEPFTQARPYHFPYRNRIISGLSYGLIVVEAAKRSGALITAHLAAEYDREVGVVPGVCHNEVSQGTNALIEDGAQKVINAIDLIEQLPEAIRLICIKKQESYNNRSTLQYDLTENERLLYAHISSMPIMLEELEKNFKDLSKLKTDLLILENKRLIERLPGERYRRRIE